MRDPRALTFVTHTNKPGGGELALRRYLEATALPVRLVTMQAGGVWEGLGCEVVHTPDLVRFRRALRIGQVVVANSMRAAFLTALVAPRSTRLVYWVRDGLVDSAMSPLALGLTRRITARRTYRYLANSAWTARTVHDALGIDPRRIDVVTSMSGVRSEGLTRAPRVRPGSPLRLLFLGRIAPWKAPDVAIRALGILHAEGVDATLTIAGGSLFGEDAYTAEVSALARTEPGVSLLGHVDPIQDLIESHDVLVHCSTVPEPFGQVLVQGLGAGLPVVATAHGGPVEILHGVPVPLLYAPGDATDLARAVVAAVSHYERLSTWSLGRAGDYTDEVAVRRADEALGRILTHVA